MNDFNELAAPCRNGVAARWNAGNTGYNLLSVDAEQDGSDDEDGADDEPSLGSNNDPCGNGTSYFFDTSHGEIDCEGDEHDGREPEADEPSLGSTATINQEAWAFGDGGDLEQGTTRRLRKPEPVS